MFSASLAALKLNQRSNSPSFVRSSNVYTWALPVLQLYIVRPNRKQLISSLRWRTMDSGSTWKMKQWEVGEGIPVPRTCRNNSPLQFWMNPALSSKHTHHLHCVQGRNPWEDGNETLPRHFSQEAPLFRKYFSEVDFSTAVYPGGGDEAS